MRDDIRAFLLGNREVFLVALLTAVALVWVVIHQTRTAAGQTPAFHLSEAGVHYILHVLNSGACTPAELTQKQPVIQAVPGADGTPNLGTFAVTLETLAPSSPTRLRVTALGQESGAKACQQIEADVESFSGVLGTKYRIVSWDHRDTVRCGALPPPLELVCAGTRED